MELKKEMIKINLENRSFDYEDLVERILSRIEDVEDLVDDEKILDALNDTLIYYDDMGMLAKEFNNSPTMEDKSGDECLDQLTCDCLEVAQAIHAQYVLMGGNQ